MIFTSDTGPTSRIWEVANATEDLAAIITEVSFPNRMQDVADVSLHLTPKTLSAELAKLKRDVPVYLYHFKPPYIEELREELAAAELAGPGRRTRTGPPVSVLTAPQSQPRVTRSVAEVENQPSAHTRRQCIYLTIEGCAQAERPRPAGDADLR